MLRRTRGWLARWPQNALDVLMGLAAFAVALLELRGVSPVTYMVVPPALLIGLVALQTLPVMVRRRAPLVVFTVLGIADVATALPIYPVRLALPAASYIALQLANYTVSAHRPRRIGLSAALVLVIGVIGAQFLRGGELGEVAWLLVSLIVPTLAVAFAGAYVRDGRIAAVTLEERTRSLEAERDESVRRAAAAERSRIARELHDVVAHSMSVMVVQAGAARRIVGQDPDRAREALRSIEVTGRDALAELRRLLGVLRRDEHDQAALAPQPGLSRLGELVARFREAGLPVELRVDVDGRSLAPGADLSAYRVIQEALTNSLKHANAEHVGVSVRADADGVELEVVDDGRGDGPGDGAGTGLIGMRERVAFFGGEIRAGPRAGGGYAVWVRFPLETE